MIITITVGTLERGLVFLSFFFAWASGRTDWLSKLPRSLSSALLLEVGSLYVWGVKASLRLLQGLRRGSVSVLGAVGIPWSLPCLAGSVFVVPYIPTVYIFTYRQFLL